MSSEREAIKESSEAVSSWISVRTVEGGCLLPVPAAPASERAPRQSRLEVWIAAGVLAAVAWPKLFWWDDPVTLLTGIGAAALLAVISGWVGGRRSAD
jgi:hypothetical protein